MRAIDLAPLSRCADAFDHLFDSAGQAGAAENHPPCSIETVDESRHRGFAVRRAKPENGLLTIDLSRELPVEMNPRWIRIGNAGHAHFPGKQAA